MLWQILVEFLFRLACGLAAAMTFTSPTRVTSGFFRVHLWVGMGFNTFIAVVVVLINDFPQRTSVMSISIAASILSYIGAVVWLYEKSTLGRWILGAVTTVNFLGALVASAAPPAWKVLDVFTASLLLGSTFAAMLLGHWYLNTPTMKLTPLKQLILVMGLAVILRTLLAGTELAEFTPRWQQEGSSYMAMLTLRWLTGIVGVLAMIVMTWQTLRIPNTQSATGILYVAVIFVFLGELTSQLLSAPSLHPV
ncbi:MAG: hypothetical protein CMJ80_17560 [Planctomycetaceae bacterium]|nr:hypothetical protein [Planctomycetaceae bacterium]